MHGWFRQGGAHTPGEILGNRASWPVQLLRVTELQPARKQWAEAASHPDLYTVSLWFVRRWGDTQSCHVCTLQIFSLRSVFLLSSGHSMSQ